MAEFYNSKYYTVNLIPEYRYNYIKLKLKWFIELLDLTSSDWPIDCTHLLKRIRSSQIIPFEYGSFELPSKYDALTEYKPDYNVYLMLINKSKVKYPFEYSYDRRLNFTLAHELAHIALDHLLIPREAKTTKEMELEEIEADEFAGRFLMPKSLMFSCNFYSLSSTSKYFNVSDTALWKRLNNIKRLDLFNSRKIPTCPQCGNTYFPFLSEYCGICGHPINLGRKGIKRIYYPEEIRLDNYKRVTECPVCKSTHFNNDRCSICGTYIFNFCSDYLINKEDGCNHANHGNSRFCVMCGKPTYFYKKGLIKPWHDLLNVGTNNGFLY